MGPIADIWASFAVRLQGSFIVLNEFKLRNASLRPLLGKQSFYLLKVLFSHVTWDIVNKYIVLK